ncbi:lytic transglycosylase domain-containing protein [Streptomyces sp. NPDC102278]|uniref:lytic transglycosylase domain-containing protein n=1 Tax=Streptomyces sp. NPDC102278 TaxID=3366152 RepID=UPI00382F85C8
MSGTDLQQISRWNAMGRLLAGRTLLHVTADMQEGAVRDGFKNAAAELRAASQAWRTAAQGWEALVDTSHPKEPSRGEAQGLNGKPVSIPTTDPHPAVAIARTSVVRSGQLLFGPRWTPEQPPGAARPAADIVADAGGEGGLAASAYRLSATGWQMAAAAPWVVRRAAAGVPAQYADLILEAAAACDQGLPPSILAAQIWAESQFDPTAVSRDSAGNPIASGIAQFIPETWARHGIDGDRDGDKDVWDPKDAIPSQGRMMCGLLRTAKAHPQYNGSPIELALAGYNAGWGRVDQFKACHPSGSRRDRRTSTSRRSWLSR